MITDAIIEFFLNPVFYLIQNLKFPYINSVEIPENAFNALLDILRPLGYFLPIKTICTCMAFLFALDTFNILWSFVLRIKSMSSVHSWL